MPAVSAGRLFGYIRIGLGAYASYFFLCFLFMPQGMQAAAWGGLVASLLFLFGIFRRAAAPLIWLALALALHSNPLIREVHLDYLGWACWLFAFLPAGEDYSLWPRPERGWNFPQEFYWAAIICLGVSYTTAGLSKLSSPDWMNGEMLRAYFHLNFGNAEFTAFALNLPPWAFLAATRLVALGEALALPLLLLPRARAWAWLMLTLGQAQMIAYSRISHIAMAMILFHFIVFDPRWLRMKSFRFLLFFAILFPFLSLANWCLYAGTIALIMLWPQARFNIIAVIAPFSFFTTRIWSYGPLLIFLQGWSVVPATLFKASEIFLAYAFSVLCLFASQVSPLWLVLPFAGYLLGVFAPALWAGSGIGVFLLGFSRVFGGLLFAVVITGLNPGILKRFSKVKASLLLNPFWPRTTIPIPATPTFLLGHEAIEEERFLRVQIEGLFLAMNFVLLAVGIALFDSFAFGLSFHPVRDELTYNVQFLNGAFDIFVAQFPHGPRPLVFAAGILAPVLRLFANLAVFFGITIAVAKMMGFDLPKYVDRPYLSTSFPNFVTRVLRYYNELILRCFILPIRRAMPGAVPTALRMPVSIFLGVFFGGFLFHFLRDVIHEDSPGSFFIRSLSDSPYFFFWGLVSAWLAYERARSGPPRIMGRLYLSTFFFVCYSCIFSIHLLVFHDHGGWQKFFAVWQVIFGLSHS